MVAIETTRSDDAVLSRIRDLKEHIRALLLDRSRRSPAPGAAPASFWTEAVRVFSYVQNLSEEDFLNIRFHAGFFTGESAYAYWHQYPPIDPAKFAVLTGYSFFARGLPEECRVGEPQPGGIPGFLGIEHEGKVINRNIARYQSCVANLHGMGVLDDLQRGGRKKVVIEVGGGYGGLAHALGGVLRERATYIVVDLPEMFYFSAAFLMVGNPGKKFYVYDPATFTPEFLEKGLLEYDFVFVPNHVLDELLALPSVDLIVNTQSFQEMSVLQVEQYLEFAVKKLDGFLYSDNLDRHPFNPELAGEGLTGALRRRFRLFPEPEFYRDRVGAGRRPWFYKAYLGVPSGRELRFSRPGPFRVVGGENRIGGDWWQVYREDGRARCEVERNLSSWLVWLARLGMRRVLKQDLKPYYQLLDQE